MKALVQRVSEASVTIGGTRHAGIGPGMLVLLGVGRADAEAQADYLAARCAELRMFNDADGKMNLSVRDMGGGVLVVSQFTLYGDTRKGNRPGFTEAAPPEEAERLYERFVGSIRKLLPAGRVETGVFRADMKISLVNDGPVTLMIESKDSTTNSTPT